MYRSADSLAIGDFRKLFKARTDELPDVLDLLAESCTKKFALGIFFIELNRMKNIVKIIVISLLVLFLPLSMCFAGMRISDTAMASAAVSGRMTVVVDAGHGGIDRCHRC